MLHATAKGKTTLYRRYLGDRDGEERKVYEEDELTSILLGPLDFLPITDVHLFWRNVLASAGHANFLPEQSPSQINMVMWSRRKAADDGNVIEPDVVVTMNWEDGISHTLLIELKWRARLSGENQLHRQWLSYLNETERSQTLHLFIAPQVSAGAQAPNNEEAGGDVWRTKDRNSLVLLPWLRIRSVLCALAEKNSGLGRWAKLTDQFLERIQIQKFGGFKKFTAEISLPIQLPPTLFWHRYTFTGWSIYDSAPFLSDPLPDPIFFHSILTKVSNDNNRR